MDKIEIINEAENNILSLLLTYQDTHNYIFEKCSYQFFEDRINREIFKVAKSIHDQGLIADNVIINQVLGNHKEINLRLYELIEYSLANKALMKQYRKILYDNYIKRLISNAQTEEDFKAIQEIKSTYDILEAKIKHISDGIDSFDERYEKHSENKIISGFKDLDEKIGSFSGGDYIALGGSTGVGKTSVALNLTRQICQQSKYVLYCSLEMPLEQLQNRLVCMDQGLNALKFRTNGFTNEEILKYKQGLENFKKLPLYVLTDYNLTVERLTAYAKEQKKTGLDMIVIDYLGLLGGYKNKSLYEKTSGLSRQIKVLATELNVPVLVLVQLNRDLKDRPDKHPVLADIRESGAIEQDADVVLFAHREGVYNPNVDVKQLELMIAKNRQGKNNQVCLLNFDLETQLITEINDNWYSMPKKGF